MDGGVEDRGLLDQDQKDGLAGREMATNTRVGNTYFVDPHKSPQQAYSRLLGDLSGKPP